MFVVLLLVLGADDGSASIALDKLTKADIPANLAPELKGLIEDTFFGNRGKEWAAVVRLGELGEEAAPAVPFVLRMCLPLSWPNRESVRGDLKGDWSRQERAFDTLHRIDPTAEGAIAVLNRSSGKVREDLIRAFGWHENPRILDAVTPLLKSTDPGLRQATIRALAEWSDRRVVPLLVDALKDPEEGVRQQAARAFAEAMWWRRPDFARVDDGTRPAAIRALRGAPVAVEALMTVVRDDAVSAYQRAVVVQILGELGDARAVAVLAEAAKSGHPALRMSAAIGAVTLTRGAIDDAGVLAPLEYSLRMAADFKHINKSEMPSSWSFADGAARDALNQAAQNGANADVRAAAQKALRYESREPSDHPPRGIPISGITLFRLTLLLVASFFLVYVRQRFRNRGTAAKVSRRTPWDEEGQATPGGLGNDEARMTNHERMTNSE